MTKVYQNRFYAMGTRCDIVLHDIGSKNPEFIYREIRDEIIRIENKLSRFLPDSEVSAVNAGASRKPVTVSDELMDILATCIEFHKKTLGYFDITLRAMLEYWNENPDGDKPRAKSLIQNLGMEHIIADKKNNTISFDNDAVQIDLGGIGKGYALERVKKVLTHHGIEHALISMGDSTISAIGKNPDGKLWTAGLKDYLYPEKNLRIFHLRDSSVSTSGNFHVDDQNRLVKFSHVINPKNGLPVEGLVTVSVCTGSALESDILSTAFLAMPDEHFKQMKSNFPEAEIIRIDHTQKPENQPTGFTGFIKKISEIGSTFRSKLKK